MCPTPQEAGTLKPFQSSGGNRYRPPRVLEALIPRSGVVRQLSDAHGQVSLLVAPPGSGKTTLLTGRFAELAGLGAHACWLSLSSEDNDPVVLRRHLIQAFPVDPGERPDELPDAPGGIAGFIDGLECLVNPSAHALVERFVLSLPPTSAFYVTTTRMRGALLHDGRLRGVVRVIAPEALRMSDDEAAAVLGGHWTSWEVARLNRFVDGWTAGLRFLARAPEACRRLLGCIDDHMAPPAEMADYFEDGICAGMTPEVLAALMELSVFDRFTPELVTAMPRPPCGWLLVEEQIRSGLFIRHADEAREWAVFHPAFGSHLRQRLRRCRPGRHDELKRFAAGWFERKGFAAEAVRHAVSIAEMPVAARIIEQAGAIMVDLSDGPDVGLGEDIPAARAGELPLVFFGQIYRGIRHGRHQEARAAYDEACVVTRNFTRLHDAADVAVVRCWTHLFEVLFGVADDLPVTEALIAAIEADLKSHLGAQPVLAASVASVLAFIYLDQSRYAESATVCGIGLNALHAATENKVAIFLRVHQASAAIACDTIDKAVLCIEEARRLAVIEGRPGSYEALISALTRAILHYECNELELAQQRIEPALAQVRSVFGWVRLYAEAYSTAAAVAGVLHGLEAAEAVLRAGEMFARERGLSRLSCFLTIARLRELTRAGEWREAVALLETAPLAALLADDGCTPHARGQQVPARLEAAHLMLELGRPQEAMALLDRIDRAFLDEADSRLRFAFHVQAMRASRGLRRNNAAVDHMLAAIEVARHTGLVRRALEAGRHLVEVFDGAVRKGRVMPARIATWVDMVLRHGGGAERVDIPQPGSYRQGAESMADSVVLSPRESEIIALMAEGCINKEIASRLGISEGTVKTHRRKLHEKLGVSSRSQAIQRARELLII